MTNKNLIHCSSYMPFYFKEDCGTKQGIINCSDKVSGGNEAGCTRSCYQKGRILSSTCSMQSDSLSHCRRQRESLGQLGVPPGYLHSACKVKNEKQHDEEIKTIDLKEKKRSKSPRALCEPELCVHSITSCLPVLANQHTNNILCVNCLSPAPIVSQSADRKNNILCVSLPVFTQLYPAWNWFQHLVQVC